MITQNPLIGRAKKSLANFTATTWKGHNVMKSKPLTVANPRTELQTDQRTRFAALVALSRQVAEIMKDAFKQDAVGKTEYNAFVSANAPWVHCTAGALNFQASHLLFSKGSLLQVSAPTSPVVVGNNVTVSWTDNTNGTGSANGTDIVRLVAFDINTKEAQVSNISKTRADGNGVFHFVNAPAANDTAFYIVVLRPTEGKAADSVMLAP